MVGAKWDAYLWNVKGGQRKGDGKSVIYEMCVFTKNHFGKEAEITEPD